MGVCRIAQSPTAESDKTSKKTMKRFLALNSMIRSTMGCLILHLHARHATHALNH